MTLALPPKFKAELEKRERQPFALVEVESDGISDEATLEADWSANVHESNVDYDGATNPPPAAGDVILATDTGENETSDIFGVSVVRSEWDSATLANIIDDTDTTYIHETLDHAGIDDLVIANSQSDLGVVPDNAHIKQVDIFARCNRSSSDTANIRLCVANSDDGDTASPYYGALVDIAVSTTITEYSDTHSTCPWTSAAWQKADIMKMYTAITAAKSGPSTTWIRCYKLWATITYYDFQTAGEIIVELDLTGANTDNNMIVSLDDVRPPGSALEYTLYNNSEYSLEVMRPSGAYDQYGYTSGEQFSYDTSTSTGSITQKLATGVVNDFTFWGRDSSNNDQWDTEPSFNSTVTLRIYAERSSGLGTIGIRVRTSAGSTIATPLVAADSAATLQWYEVDVTAYVGDLADLRVIAYGGTGTGTTQTLTIYDINITGIILSGGTVVEDGDRISTEGGESVAVKAALSGDSAVTPVVKSIGGLIPDRIYRYSSKKVPAVLGSLPILDDLPGRSLEVSAKDLITIGSNINLKIARRPAVDKMLRENYMRGLHTTVFIGFFRPDLAATSDLLFYYQGRISEYTVSQLEAEITVKDAAVDLDVKVPSGTPPTTAPSKTYDGTNLVDVILDLLDDAGIANRYIDRGSFATVRANLGDSGLTNPPPGVENWKAYRTGTTVVKDPKPVKEYIKQILEVIGCYLIMGEDGKLKLLEWDASTAAEGDDWTDGTFTAIPVYTRGLDSIKNETILFFDWDGDGKDGKDYLAANIDQDTTSRDNYGGQFERRIIKTDWIAGDEDDGYFGAEIAAHAAERETIRLKDGLGILKGKTNLNKADAQVADMVDIISSVIVNPFVLPGEARKFFITKKEWNFLAGSITWRAVEVNE